MIRLHWQIGSGAPGPGSEMRVLEGGNAMNEVDPVPAGRKKHITLWPSIKTCFLFALVMLLLGSVASAGGPVTVEDRLVCGGTEVRVFTTCTFDPALPVASPCIEQHFLFVNDKEKVSRRIP